MATTLTVNPYVAASASQWFLPQALVRISFPL